MLTTLQTSIRENKTVAGCLPPALRGHSCSLHIHSLTAAAVERMAAARLSPDRSPTGAVIYRQRGGICPAAPQLRSAEPPRSARPQAACPAQLASRRAPLSQDLPGPAARPRGAVPPQPGWGLAVVSDAELPRLLGRRRRPPARLHIIVPLGSLLSSLLPAAAWERRSPCAAPWPWLGASALRASPEQQRSCRAADGLSRH